MDTTPKTLHKAIISSIRKSLLELGSATKAELSEKLDISFPTISKFLSQMEKGGEIFSVGLDESSGGRRAKRYAYNPEYMLGLAVFLEKTETNYTIFNCVGEVKEQGETPSVLVDGGVNLLTKFIEEIVAETPSKICSIAIGVPGSVDNGKIFYVPGYEDFHDLDLEGYYEDYFSIPVVVENDINAAVLGFSHHNRMKDNQSLIYMYFGQNGPGAGLMINGDVVRGKTFFAGEVSFVPQYKEQNFGQALENRSSTKEGSVEYQIDSISRFVATCTAIINPHTVIFSNDEIETEMLSKVAIESSKYIPAEHLPELTVSEWKQDYLYGLQRLCLDLMIMNDGV
ncbi:ROK family transcriptional regulator [Oceanobacillus arenosus]|uniref:ROK family transcriptional regulator n=1 Tax=Oceanobacillus arenosus TaxID=1229153 RepID=UPI000E20EE0C